MPKGIMTPPNYLPSDYRRRDNIKNGFEELERIVPHAGRLDGEKLSQASHWSINDLIQLIYSLLKSISFQASVLFDAGNHIKRVTRESAELAREIQAVKSEMERLNAQIE